MTFVWVEKYRPTKLDQCVFPNRLKDIFQGIVSSKDKSFPNMLFHGGPGCGKTTVASILCDLTKHESMKINGSKDAGIETLRTTIQQFASSVSFDSHRKCVILNEADFINPNTTQPALRGFIEEFSSNCAFIFTCNYLFKILKEIHSRCTVMDFTVRSDEEKDMRIGMTQWIKQILESEKVKFDKKVLSQHVRRYFPDFRRTINELQAYSIAHNKTIDEGILSRTGSITRDINQVTEFIRRKDYKSMYEWVVTSDYDPGIFTDLWNFWMEGKFLKDSALAEATYILSDFEFKATQAINPKLNLCSCLGQVMTNCEFV